MGDNYKNQPEQPKATPLWTAEKQIMESVDIEKTVVVNNKPAKQSKSYGKNQKPKKPFNKLWLVIPLCLALVAGTVLCGYLAFFNSKGDDDTEESSAVTDSSADSSEVLEGKGFNWMLENGILTITGIGPMPNFTVESPAPWANAGEITAVVISNGITSIGDFAFYECEDVTSVTIPSTVITIGKGAFEDCNSLESITVPEGVASIDDGAFAGSGLTSVTIPSTVTDMGSDLFNHCAELISIVYNGTKEQWDAIEKDDTWQGNAPIKTVHCNDTAFDPQNPDAVLEYDAQGTTDKGLTWTLLDGTLTISGEGEMDDFPWDENLGLIFGEQWLESAEKIKTVLIKDGITCIGTGAFSSCPNLVNVNIPLSVTTIKEGAFASSNSLATIYIPKSVASIEKFAFHGSSLFNINVDKENQNYTDINGVLFTKNAETLIKYPLGKTAKSYSIPYGVKSIEYAAFFAHDYVTDIKIPGSVTSLGDYVFACSSSLESIEIPNSITEISGWAFSNCSALKNINLHDNIMSISCNAFEWCTSLTTVTVPNGVTCISFFTFSGCTSLTSVTIPNSVTKIESWAFSECTALTRFCYSGTKAQWEKVELEEYWNQKVPFTDIIYTDGASSNLSKEALKEKVEKLGGGSAIEFWYDDYDGNGTYEAFALVGEYDDSRIPYKSGDFWYVDSEYATLLHEGVFSEVSNENSMLSEVIGGQNKKGVILTYIFTGTTDVLKAWVVKNGVPTESVFFDKAASVVNVAGGNFELFQLNYDSWECSDPSGTHCLNYRTYKPYYFYFDDNKGDFAEYGGIAISESQLSTIPAGNKVLTDLKAKENCVIRNIYYRANGVINISYYNILSAEQPCKGNRYITLRKNPSTGEYEEVEDDGSYNLFDEGTNVGYYDAAMYPDMATYPASFDPYN